MESLYVAPYVRINGTGSKGQVLPSQHTSCPPAKHFNYS